MELYKTRGSVIAYMAVTHVVTRRAQYHIRIL